MEAPFTQGMAQNKPNIAVGVNGSLSNGDSVKVADGDTTLKDKERMGFNLFINKQHKNSIKNLLKVAAIKLKSDKSNRIAAQGDSIGAGSFKDYSKTVIGIRDSKNICGKTNIKKETSYACALANGVSFSEGKCDSPTTDKPIVSRPEKVNVNNAAIIIPQKPSEDIADLSKLKQTCHIQQPGSPDMDEDDIAAAIDDFLFETGTYTNDGDNGRNDVVRSSLKIDIETKNAANCSNSESFTDKRAIAKVSNVVSNIRNRCAVKDHNVSVTRETKLDKVGFSERSEDVEDNIDMLLDKSAVKNIKIGVECIHNRSGDKSARVDGHSVDNITAVNIGKSSGDRVENKRCTNDRPKKSIRLDNPDFKRQHISAINKSSNSIKSMDSVSVSAGVLNSASIDQMAVSCRRESVSNRKTQSIREDLTNINNASSSDEEDLLFMAIDETADDNSKCADESVKIDDVSLSLDADQREITRNTHYLTETTDRLKEGGENLHKTSELMNSDDSVMRLKKLNIMETRAASIESKASSKHVRNKRECDKIEVNISRIGAQILNKIESLPDKIHDDVSNISSCDSATLEDTKGVEAEISSALYKRIQINLTNSSNARMSTDIINSLSDEIDGVKNEIKCENYAELRDSMEIDWCEGQSTGGSDLSQPTVGSGTTCAGENAVMSPVKTDAHTCIGVNRDSSIINANKEPKGIKVESQSALPDVKMGDIFKEKNCSCTIDILGNEINQNSQCHHDNEIDVSVDRKVDTFTNHVELTQDISDTVVENVGISDLDHSLKRKHESDNDVGSITQSSQAKLNHDLKTSQCTKKPKISKNCESINDEGALCEPLANPVDPRLGKVSVTEGLNTDDKTLSDSDANLNDQSDVSLNTVRLDSLLNRLGKRIGGPVAEENSKHDTDSNLVAVEEDISNKSEKTLKSRGRRKASKSMKTKVKAQKTAQIDKDTAKKSPVKIQAASRVTVHRTPEKIEPKPTVEVKHVTLSTPEKSYKRSIGVGASNLTIVTEKELIDLMKCKLVDVLRPQCRSLVASFTKKLSSLEEDLRKERNMVERLRSDITALTCTLAKEKSDKMQLVNARKDHWTQTIGVDPVNPLPQIKQPVLQAINSAPQHIPKISAVSVKPVLPMAPIMATAPTLRPAITPQIVIQNPPNHVQTVRSMLQATRSSVHAAATPAAIKPNHLVAYHTQSPAQTSVVTHKPTNGVAKVIDLTSDELLSSNTISLVPGQPVNTVGVTNAALQQRIILTSIGNILTPSAIPANNFVMRNTIASILGTQPSMAITSRPIMPNPSTSVVTRSPIVTSATITQNILTEVAKPVSLVLHQPTAKHPAPLPDIPAQNAVVDKKVVPPKPTLQITRANNGIVLSWTLSLSDEHSDISTFRIYAYQETTSPPNKNLWKKVGDVKAMPLPMACTLTQFQEGHKYHFSVQAMDIYDRLGPHSDPNTITLLSEV